MSTKLNNINFIIKGGIYDVFKDIKNVIMYFSEIDANCTIKTLMISQVFQIQIDSDLQTHKDFGDLTLTLFHFDTLITYQVYNSSL